MESIDQLTLAEEMMSPTMFAKNWCEPYEMEGVWYSAPRPYLVGFITALSMDAAEQCRDSVRKSMQERNRLVWC